jgi:drug/metabolite transporter (DMT)-like permease
VTPILLATLSAALFGGMTVALGLALAHGAPAEAAAFLTVVPAFGVAVAVVLVRGAWEPAGVWPFLLAGLLGPGLSQLLFTLGVRDAGPSRTSVAVATAPLFSVAIAFVWLDEPVVAGIVAGALAIVAGGGLLAAERKRPASFRAIGVVFALGAALAFATRDNLVRRLALDTDVDPALAAAATLAAGGLAILAFALPARARTARLGPGRARGLFRGLRLYAPAGAMFGLSYVCLFEAYCRGRVSVVSPIVATESLWGVGLSALLLGRRELVGARLAAGAALVGAGGILIGVSR